MFCFERNEQQVLGPPGLMKFLKAVSVNCRKSTGWLKFDEIDTNQNDLIKNRSMVFFASSP